MTHITVAAKDVKVGDLIFWPWIFRKRSGRLDWTAVVRVEPSELKNHISIHVSGQRWTVKHQEEAVAVMRETE